MRKELIIICVLILSLLNLFLAAAALSDNLTSSWNLDESSGVIADAHGSNNGTYNGALYSQTGKINTAIGFDGSNDQIDLSETLSDSTTLTISAWVYYKGGSSISTIFSDCTSAGGNDLIFDMNSTGIGIRADKSSATLQYQNAKAVGGLNLGNAWHQLVWVMNSSESKIYVDGSLVVTITEPAGNVGYHDAAIGGFAYVIANQFNGTIDELRVWNRTLSAAEVLDLYDKENAGISYPWVAVDSCSCPGLASNWEINMSDFCNITADCNLSTGKLSFTGTGITRINATISTSDLGDPGSNGILEILVNCLIWILG